MSTNLSGAIFFVKMIPDTMYRVYQPNFPIDSSKITNVNGEIWLIDPVEHISEYKVPNTKFWELL